MDRYHCLPYILPPNYCIDVNNREHDVNNLSLQRQECATLQSWPLKNNSMTMLHTSIDGGFDEACISDDEYYFDGMNDQSWACSFGTWEEVCPRISIFIWTHHASNLSFFLSSDKDGIWMVRNDLPGTIIALTGAFRGCVWSCFDLHMCQSVIFVPRTFVLFY